MNTVDYIHEPVLCYLLDGILIVYCIIATGFFFKEKLSNLPPVNLEPPEDNGIYQELERPNDTDPYQVLEPTKRKKKAAKKKKPKKSPAKEREQESMELRASAAAPPLPPL